MVEIADSAGARGQSSDVKVIGLVSVAHFISHYFVLLLPPLFVQIKAEYGVGYAELALPITAFSLASALLQTPAGFLVDRLGARKMLIGGLIVGSAAVPLFAAAPAVWMVVALFAVLCVANTVYHPADYAILSQACGTSRA